MPSEEENKEITVKAPSKPIVSSDKQTEKTTEKALEEERFKVLQFPNKISRFFGLIAAGTGVSILFLFLYMAVTMQTSSILISSASGPLNLVGWGFVGLLNIVVGFLFLGRE
jgi:hypothetical protein